MTHFAGTLAQKLINCPLLSLTSGFLSRLRARTHGSGRRSSRGPSKQRDIYRSATLTFATPNLFVSVGSWPASALYRPPLTITASRPGRRSDSERSLGIRQALATAAAAHLSFALSFHLQISIFRSGL